MVIVELRLQEATGKFSRRIYIGSARSLRRIANSLALVLQYLKVMANSTTSGDMVKVNVQITNTGAVASLQNKLTLMSVKNKDRILPAYYSDNYVSLLPGEVRNIEIEYPVDKAQSSSEIALRGWNSASQTIAVAAQK